jgi:outer membrane usher protein FimD/PapC
VVKALDLHHHDLYLAIWKRQMLISTSGSLSAAAREDDVWNQRNLTSMLGVSPAAEAGRHLMSASVSPSANRAEDLRLASAVCHHRI